MFSAFGFAGRKLANYGSQVKQMLYGRFFQNPAIKEKKETIK